MNYALVGGAPIVRKDIREFRKKLEIFNYVMKWLGKEGKRNVYWYVLTERPEFGDGNVKGKDEMTLKYGPKHQMTNFYHKYLKDTPDNIEMHIATMMEGQGVIKLGKRKERDILFVKDDETLEKLYEMYPSLKGFAVLQIGRVS